MNRILLFFWIFCLPLIISAQDTRLDTVCAPKVYDNIYSIPLYHDSLVSSFVIFIRKEVKLHAHATHAEHVLVLEGEGEMVLGEKIIKVKKGSLVFIPSGVPHSLRVTSGKPVKVLSVQAPYFDGKDRILLSSPK
ncbi:MAG: cupin domain-containing protein [Bacteroidia bacterium]|nr:cupin domain-containing protein [Bacteroidia bacterium]